MLLFITQRQLRVNHMRTDQEMFGLILQTAETLKVEAVALSGSRTDTKAPKDEFQDYDVVYLVENFEELISDLSWLDQFGNRMIEQDVRLGHRRLFLMLLEDGNRIDLTLCPKDHMKEWVDSESIYTVLVDDKGLFESYYPNPQRYWTSPATEKDFGGYQLTWSKAFVVIKLSM